MGGHDGRGPSPEEADSAARRRAELRAEARAYEELAARDLLRSRTLTDVAVELLSRGDRVVVEVAGRALSGVVVHAAGDLACLRTPGGEVDVSLTAPLVVRVVERARAGGLDRGAGPPGFAARMAEHERAGSRVELGLRTGTPGGRVVGVVAAVGVDHVVMDTDDGRAYVARGAIGYAVGLGG